MLAINNGIAFISVPPKFTLTNLSQFKKQINELSNNKSVNVIVLKRTENSKHFNVGLDLGFLASLLREWSETTDVTQRSLKIQHQIKEMQSAFTSLQECCKPVIAVIEGGCIGAGIELISAADIRICSDKAFFCLKEIDVGLAADLGGLQRLPLTVSNQSALREWIYTGKTWTAREALQYGLVSAISMEIEKYSYELATTIASKSLVVLQGIKKFTAQPLNNDSLDSIAVWNSIMLNQPMSMSSKL